MFAVQCERKRICTAETSRKFVRIQRRLGAMGGSTKVDQSGTIRLIRATGSKTSALAGVSSLNAHHVLKYFMASAASSGASSTAMPISLTCVIDFQSMLAEPR